MPARVVVDIAGAVMGGAARWVAELDGFLDHSAASVAVVGRRRRLTAGWLAGREVPALRGGLVVAANNASFLLGGGERRVVLRNALHFLHSSEEHLLAGMRSLRAQIPVVRRLLARADTIVVPTSAMADRVCHRMPAVRGRVVIGPHPVTPEGPRRPALNPFVLVPVLPAPYKNLVPQLATLLAALDRIAAPLEVRVTAHPADLPGGLARHPRLVLLGTVPHATLAGMWQQATGAFFPSILEAFGYPLAEARVYGVPVLAPDSPQAREVAGAALVPYRSGDLNSLTAAVERLADPVTAEPYAFDRDTYFRWLLGLPPSHRAAVTRESHGIAS